MNDRNAKKNFETLEKELLREYDSLNQRNPRHPLLGLIQRKGEGFVFTSLFDRHYIGGAIRKRYEMYVEDMKAA